MPEDLGNHRPWKKQIRSQCKFLNLHYCFLNALTSAVDLQDHYAEICNSWPGSFLIRRESMHGQIHRTE